MSINWRASLVPAAAVIPAPKAYIKVAAVKKLVVWRLLVDYGLLFEHELDWFYTLYVAFVVAWLHSKCAHIYYFEESTAFIASICCECASMAWFDKANFRICLTLHKWAMNRRGRGGYSYYRARGGILRLRYDGQLRKHLSVMLPPIKNESKGTEDD